MARQGRPAELVEDATPFDGPTIDVRRRVAWLLRVSRLASGDPDAVSLSRFAARMDGMGVRADGPRVSAWEHGRAAVPRAAVVGYSRLLHLPPGQLRATAEGLAATFGAGRHTLLHSAQDEAALQASLDRVHDTLLDPSVRGGDWLGFAELLTLGHAVLMPSRMVEPLVRRLLNETMRSAGIAYATRFRALVRLVGHPHWGPMTRRAVQDAVREPGAQGVIDAMALLGEVPDGATVRWLFRVLLKGSGPVQVGTAHALLNLLVTRTFPAGELDGLERTLAALTADRTDPASRGLAQLLASRLDDARRVRLVARAGVTARSRAFPAATGSTAWLGPFVAAARSVLPAVPDRMFERLVREAVASRYVERRHHASLLLMASPYRAATAAAAIEVVEGGDDGELRQGAAGLLSYLSGPGERASLTSWLLGGEPERQRSALLASAHGPGLDPAVDVHGLVRSGPALAGVASYAAGMSAHPALSAWAGDPDAAAPLRQAARWWLASGPAVTDRPEAA